MFSPFLVVGSSGVEKAEAEEVQENDEQLTKQCLYQFALNQGFLPGNYSLWGMCLFFFSIRQLLVLVLNCKHTTFRVQVPGHFSSFSCLGQSYV